jgi:hypothetical protein
LITTGGKLWFAIGAFAVVAAEIYFLCTGGEDGGAVTLLFLGVAALVIGGAAVAVRDGDAAVAGEGTKEPVVVRAALPAPWPVVAAIGAGLTVVGYAVGGVLLYGGFGLMGIALLEWMVQGWAERTTGDRAYNQALRNRIMYPIEVPALGLLGVGFVILTFSRILLAAPTKDVSTIIAIAVGVVITAGAFLVASRPKISSNALAWVLAVGAVALLGAGIVTGVAGERGVEHHAEHEPAAGDIEEGHGGGNDAGEGTIADDGNEDDAETPGSTTP